MRATGWSNLLRPFVDGPTPKHVVTERELLEVVVLAGRRVNGDYRTVLAHCMRALHFKLHSYDRTYRRKAPKDGRAS